jgi:tetratricopeptide (TPR) repeat protein
MHVRIGFAHVLGSLILLLAAAAHADDDLFQKGLAAYQNKQYAEAKDDFQKLLDQGKVTPGVLNNLALSLYQLDQKPMALALWRKALSLQPGFQPAREGRELLENKLQMRPLEHDSLSLWVHRTLEHISIYELLWLNAALLAIAGWYGFRYWGERAAALDEERELPVFPGAFAASAAVLALALVAAGSKFRDALSPRATVVSAKASARSLPADDAVPLFDVGGGHEVLVRRQQSGWLQVQNSDGASGWLKVADVLVTTDR